MEYEAKGQYYSGRVEKRDARDEALLLARDLKRGTVPQEPET